MSKDRIAPDRPRLPGSARSLWLVGRQRPSFPALARDLEVDVAVVGAGITGLSAGVMLAEAGKRVAVVEQQRVAGGETGHTTGHMTEVLDTPYAALSSVFGAEGARLAAESSRVAIDACEDRIRKDHIECAFVRLPAFLFTENPAEVTELQEEAGRMASYGCAASWTTQVPVPFPVAGGIRVEGQPQIDAYAYCTGLAHALTRAGGQIFELSRATRIENGEPCVVETAEGRILRARSVIVAGHVPFNNRVLVHTKLAAYRTYVLAAPTDAMLSAILFDTARPYHYVRTHRKDTIPYLLAGGEDHRTGIENEGAGAYANLAKYLSNRFASGPVKYRWSGQIVEPVDGLPYIGANSLQSHVYIATGYAGNGVTFGVLAGLILCDLILDRPNRFASLYDATRLPALQALGTYVRENAPFPVTLVKDRLTMAHVDDGSVESVARGAGKVLQVRGVKAAVSRDEQGRLRAVSVVCPHLGCDVRWNDAEKTWDCPCHGSRFSRDGHVLNGPAASDLPPVELT